MPHIGEKQETEMLTSTKVAEDASNQRSDYILRPTLDCSYNLMQSSELGPHPKISVLWGRTFSHCLIKPEKFPIRHELVSVFPKQYVITDALPNLELLRSLLPEKNFEIELRQISNEGQRTSGVPESWLLIEDNAVSRNSHIIVVRSKNTEMKHTVGYARTLDNATMFSYNLDVLAMLIFDVSDVRLLWSDDPRLWQQFTALVDFKCGNQLNLQSILYNDITFKSFSIYPPAYIHDISIWERSNETRLSESEFFSLMREITHHQILNVYLKDQYVHPKTGSKSRCYRMVHQSPDKALSKCKATELQIQLRAALRDRFGIYVR
ncbi:ferredoxin-fold anticodon-binding domain-containing protein 1-like [Saccoglossus kowalevskii]|uniref:Ferredoxin-fold anticodon-binding domain-containing protein 1-like n=1 Tax=Saccoglossus kowalevskii TaxID=10224 RepID=A0ABM0MLQ2_SACKO|nr:PREDICTED: ferredoxin-fold anticodon-binding domain-containing protein 1-like [Saccoglossus kowalevskii]